MLRCRRQQPLCSGARRARMRRAPALPPNQGSDHRLGSESGDAAQRVGDHWALRIAGHWPMVAPDGVVIARRQWVAAGKTLSKSLFGSGAAPLPDLTPGRPPPTAHPCSFRQRAAHCSALALLQPHALSASTTPRDTPHPATRTADALFARRRACTRPPTPPWTRHMAPMVSFPSASPARPLLTSHRDRSTAPGRGYPVLHRHPARATRTSVFPGPAAHG
jgi:hypothetical protein